MRAEKQILTKEYLGRLNASPFFIVVGYTGLKVDQLTKLRKSLNGSGAEVHVVKNSIFRIAAKEAGVADLNGALAGQIAVVEAELRDQTIIPKPAEPFDLPIRDPADRWVLASAVAGQADQLVTGDRDLLTIADQAPLPVLTPRESWEFLRRNA